jgi:hypothetical protein
MEEGGKNPLSKEENKVLRIKPKLKIKNQIGFQLNRTVLTKPLKTRFKNHQDLDFGKYEVNLNGEIFGYSEIWCSLKNNEEKILILQREMNKHYNEAKAEVNSLSI